MFTFLIVGFLLLGPTSANVTPHDETMRTLFYHTGACGSQHGRTLDDPDYYSSNSGMPHDPSTTGHMATHGTHRFLAMHEQTALLVGEGKHGVWRFQENGFIRVYRNKDEDKSGIPAEMKERALDLKRVEEDEENNRLFEILQNNYKNFNQKYMHEFNYAFGDEVSQKGLLNWIDLPIYHAKFDKKYDDHVPIDLPVYYCQMSSENFPNMGPTWHLMKAQPRANKVGPLGKRAGMDIRENFNDVVRFYLFPDAGLWGNIGQGIPETDAMQKTLEELRERVQTVNWQRLDLGKVDVEVYVMERGYHNYNDTYLHMAVVFLNKENETEHSYIRPHGKYYEGLLERKHTIVNTVPNNAPRVPIVYSSGLKEVKLVYGLAAYGHHHMARIKYGLSGGGCPNKGGDIADYPWGNPGSGWPTNYEEITPLCDGFLIDIKTWANLDHPWSKDDLFLGNAGHTYGGDIQVEFQAHANRYGVFTDPYNAGKTNPYELDFTENHDFQANPGNDASHVPVVNFTIDFGKPGKVNEYVNVALDLSPRPCSEESKLRTAEGANKEQAGTSKANAMVSDALGLMMFLTALFI